MQIFHFSVTETIIIDVLAWIVIHLSIGYFTSQLPISFFNPQRKWYQTYSWEKNGRIYEELFHVRSWKKYIPYGGKLYPNTFSMQKLKSMDMKYLTLWLKESCRAEFCHWMMILPGFLFFLWNTVEVGWWMVFYAFLNNLFPIVMQRFNRPRIRLLIKRVAKETDCQSHTGKALGYDQEILNSYC